MESTVFGLKRKLESSHKEILDLNHIKRLITKFLEFWVFYLKTQGICPKIICLLRI
jgi:hypothetical protein